MEPQETETTTLTFLVKKFKEFYDAEKVFKTKMEEARALKEQWEEALLAKMLEEEVQNLTTGEGMFYSREDVYANYDKGREEEFFGFLSEAGAGDLIRPTVNARTLTAWVRERMEDGEDIPEFVTIATKRRIGVRAK